MRKIAVAVVAVLLVVMAVTFVMTGTAMASLPQVTFVNNTGKTIDVLRFANDRGNWASLVHASDAPKPNRSSFTVFVTTRRPLNVKAWFTDGTVSEPAWEGLDLQRLAGATIYLRPNGRFTVSR